MTNLRGRFHNSAHAAFVKRLSRLCAEDSQFRLPGAANTPDGTSSLPLRSNVNGDVIELGINMHDVALESLLEKPCLWSQTVSGMFKKGEDLPYEDLALIPIGSDHFVPISFKRRVLRPLQAPNKCSGVQGLPIDRETYESTSATEDWADNKSNTDRFPVTEPIAITGMGCRYAQADSPELLWEILRHGKCAVSPLPNKRFKINDLARKPDGPFFGNYLENPDVFDHRFFGISAREAEAMDPQQRLILQVAYESMESAGYTGLKKSTLPTDIGCYIGVGSDDYTDNIGSVNANAFSAMGTLQAFNSGRVSHFFGWSGPSLVLDTACSSAAVAIHLACKVWYMPTYCPDQGVTYGAYKNDFC